MNEPRPAPNWPEVHARLERARQALDAGAERAPDEARRILAARARAFAQPAREAPSADAAVDLVVFSLAGERYAVAAARVVEVILLRDLVTIPGTPRVVLGIVNHRGLVLPVLDLRRVFDLAGEEVGEGSRILAAESGGSMVGIFAEAVAGVVRVGATELRTRPSGSVGSREPFVLSVTTDMVTVLDVDALITDPRVTVNEEVG